MAIVVENPPANARSSSPGSGGSPGEGTGNPLQCSCLGKPTDGGAWRAAVHGAAKSDTAEHSTAHPLRVLQSEDGRSWGLKTLPAPTV